MQPSFVPSEIRPRILLVGADDTCRAANASALREAGYCPECEADADGAWTALCERGYGIVLVDHRLSGVSGLRLILRMSQSHLTLPAILVIDAALPFAPQTHRRFHSLIVLARPFGAERLLVTVLEALRGTRAFKPVHSTRSPTSWNASPRKSERKSLQRGRTTPSRRVALTQ